MGMNHTMNPFIKFPTLCCWCCSIIDPLKDNYYILMEHLHIFRSLMEYFCMIYYFRQKGIMEHNSFHCLLKFQMWTIWTWNSWLLSGKLTCHEWYWSWKNEMVLTVDYTSFQVWWLICAVLVESSHGFNHYPNNRQHLNVYIF